MYLAVFFHFCIHIAAFPGQLHDIYWHKQHHIFYDYEDPRVIIWTNHVMPGLALK